MIRLKESQRDDLRRAWYGRETAKQLEARFGMRMESIRTFWHREKAAGRLPSDGQPRPFFQRNTVALPPRVAVSNASCAPVDVQLDAEIERSEILAESAAEQSVVDCNTSLAALRLAHPDLDNTRSHTAPDAWLTRDRDPRLAPSPEQLRAMARKHDSGAHA